MIPITIKYISRKLIANAISKFLGLREANSASQSKCETESCINCTARCCQEQTRIVWNESVTAPCVSFSDEHRLLKKNQKIPRVKSMANARAQVVYVHQGSTVWDTNMELDAQAKKQDMAMKNSNLRLSHSSSATPSSSVSRTWIIILPQLLSLMHLIITDSQFIPWVVPSFHTSSLFPDVLGRWDYFIKGPVNREFRQMRLIFLFNQGLSLEHSIQSPIRPLPHVIPTVWPSLVFCSNMHITRSCFHFPFFVGLYACISFYRSPLLFTHTNLWFWSCLNAEPL